MIVLPEARARMAVIFLLLPVLTACGMFGKDKEPDPTLAVLTIQAAADANPDPRERPTPVLVRVYELRSSTAFEGSDLFTLLEDDQSILGPDLANRWEYQLEPGGQVSLETEFGQDSGFVGVIAAFREVEVSRWRSIAPVEANQANEFEVVISRREVQIR